MGEREAHTSGCAGKGVFLITQAGFFCLFLFASLSLFCYFSRILFTRP